MNDVTKRRTFSLRGPLCVLRGITWRRLQQVGHVTRTDEAIHSYLSLKRKSANGKTEKEMERYYT
jgi:hypothetical protein